jgi:hypothetical protein
MDLGPQAAQDGHLIAAAVSPELDALKEEYWALPDFLTQLVGA